MADTLPIPPEPLPPPGWLHDPNDGSKERYWDGASWTDQTRPENSFRRRFHFSPYWLLGGFVALIIVWATGIFDEQLVGIHLNARDCVEQSAGDYVCGGEAEDIIDAQENPVPPPLPPSITSPGTPPLPGDPATPGIPGDPTVPGGVPTVPDLGTN